MPQICLVPKSTVGNGYDDGGAPFFAGVPQFGSSRHDPPEKLVRRKLTLIHTR